MQAMMSMASISHPEGLGGDVGGYVVGAGRHLFQAHSSLYICFYKVTASGVPRLKCVGRLNCCLTSLLNSPDIFGAFVGSRWRIAFSLNYPEIFF